MTEIWPKTIKFCSFWFSLVAMVFFVTSSYNNYSKDSKRTIRYKLSERTIRYEASELTTRYNACIQIHSPKECKG